MITLIHTYICTLYTYSNPHKCSKTQTYITQNHTHEYTLTQYQHTTGTHTQPLHTHTAIAHKLSHTHIMNKASFSIPLPASPSSCSWPPYHRGRTLFLAMWKREGLNTPSSGMACRWMVRGLPLPETVTPLSCDQTALHQQRSTQHAKHAQNQQ